MINVILVKKIWRKEFLLLLLLFQILVGHIIFYILKLYIFQTF